MAGRNERQVAVAVKSEDLLRELIGMSKAAGLDDLSHFLEMAKLKAIEIAQGRDGHAGKELADRL